MPKRVLLLAGALALLIAAPASARITFFQTPGKNIHCVYVSSFNQTPIMRCDTDFATRFKKRPPHCEFDFGRAFTVTARGHGHLACVSDSANDPKAQKLVVGQERTFGPFTCKAPARNSVRCTSARGHGFLLAPTRQLLY